MEQKFIEWASTLSKEFREAQLKTAIQVNCSLINFFSDLGREIYHSPFKEKNNPNFYGDLSKELIKTTSKELLFSADNLEYIEAFYALSVEIYKMILEENSVSLDDSEKCISLSTGMFETLSKITWSHYQVIIDQFSNDQKKRGSI